MVLHRALLPSSHPRGPAVGARHACPELAVLLDLPSDALLMPDPSGLFLRGTDRV
jgi:hypothetical protein